MRCVSRHLAPVFMPVGQIAPRSEILSSSSEKHKSLVNFAKSALWCTRSVAPEGRFAIVTDVGNGMRWTRRAAAELTLRRRTA
jgi:hypothetical protein